VKAAAQGKLHEGAKDVTPEQMELPRLRAPNARLKLEVEILEKATAYFANDALSSTPGSKSIKRCIR
jgi:transposase